MSINKNAYLRYQVLDKCFSNRYRMFFIDDLLDEVNKALEEFNGEGSKLKEDNFLMILNFWKARRDFPFHLKGFVKAKKFSTDTAK